MFKTNAWFWVSIGIAVVGALIGIVAASTADIGSGIFVGAMVLGSFALVYFIFFRPMLKTKKLQAEGISATGKILEINDTGVTVNNSPQIKVKVEVTHPFHGIYTAEFKMLISRLDIGVFKPGMEIPLKVSKENKEEMTFDYSGGKSGSGYSTGMTSEEATRIATEFDEYNKKVEATGIEARAIILKTKPLGFTVNGNNPAMEFELQVLPEGKDPFKSTARAVILETSTRKYEPGDEILIKYDKYNTQQVAIYKSLDT